MYFCSVLLHRRRCHSVQTLCVALRAQVTSCITKVSLPKSLINQCGTFLLLKSSCTLQFSVILFTCYINRNAVMLLKMQFLAPLCLFVLLVFSAFPLCLLAEEDLIQNPLFSKLLATLSQHVDHTGLTLHLKKELLEV